jgi:hypothetical protein
MTPEKLNNALLSAALTYVQEIKTGNYSISWTQARFVGTNPTDNR